MNLSEREIRSYLVCENDLRFRLFECVGSTNTIAKENRDEPEGLVIAAQSQSEGQGRFGRKFHSPESGLYTSILLKPKLDGTEVGFITVIAAVAVCMTIERLTTEKPGIKWVNDILLFGKKVCGILTIGALTPSGASEYAVLGIGVNLSCPKDGFAQDIADIAGAVFHETDPGMTNRFLAELLNNFFALYNEFDRVEIARQYRDRSIVIGRDINVSQGNETYSAHVVDMDERCNLILRCDDGVEKKLFCGEVSIRLK